LPLLKDVDYVFHIAGVTKAKRRQDYTEGNVIATQKLLEAAAQQSIKKFCLLSSLTAVGPSRDGTPLDESTPPHPITAYGISKRQAEEAALSYNRQFPVVILRPPAVYGPRDKDILEMFRVAKLGFKPIIGSRNKTLSLIHVSDLARAIVQATVSEKTHGEVYFVTDERIYRYDDLCDELARIVGKKALSVPVPSAALLGIAAVAQAISLLGPRPAVLSMDKARDLLQAHWVCTARKLKSHIGFETSIEIREGLQSTHEWYEQRGWLSFKTMLGYHG
jgi:nucleoside-diphosphate-sugar epimerase